MFAVGFRRTTRVRLALGALTIGALVASMTVVNASAAGAAAPAGHVSTAGLVVATNDGRVMGKTVGTTDEFLGLPYAAPPVGALRWREPRPATRWRGVRNATAFAPHCAQSASPFGLASFPSGRGEPLWPRFDPPISGCSRWCRRSRNSKPTSRPSTTADSGRLLGRPGSDSRCGPASGRPIDRRMYSADPSIGVQVKHRKI
jgi:hypothetical protein